MSEIDFYDLGDESMSAFEEAMNFGVSYDSFYRLAKQVANHYQSKISKLEEELEIEKQKLIACSVAATGWFEGCDDKYWDVALMDVVNLRNKYDEVSIDAQRYNEIKGNVNFAVLIMEDSYATSEPAPDGWRELGNDIDDVVDKARE